MTLDLRFGRWQDVLADVECEALIVDAPYSERTHDGHDAGTANVQPTLAKHGSYQRACGHPDYAYARASIDYPHYTSDDVHAFVAHWAPRTRGWMVSLTDDVLFPVWREAMREAGRTVFQDVAAIIRGMTVRLAGDGPSSWTIHCAMSRPATREFASWGTTPGGYYGPSERQAVTGGKPLWLLRALVRDYTRPGDLVCDPCAGGATTLLAAAMEGRRAVGAEMDPETHAKALRRIADTAIPVRPLLAETPRAVQGRLLEDR